MLLTQLQQDTKGNIMDIFLLVGMDEQDLAENFTGCWNSQFRVKSPYECTRPSWKYFIKRTIQSHKILGSHGNDSWADSNQYHLRTQSFLGRAEVSECETQIFGPNFSWEGQILTCQLGAM